MSHSEPRRADSEKGNETDSAKNEKWKDISGKNYNYSYDFTRKENMKSISQLKKKKKGKKKVRNRGVDQHTLHVPSLAHSCRTVLREGRHSDLAFSL